MIESSKLDEPLSNNFAVLKVTDLRQECKKWGVPVYGTKSTLLIRLGKIKKEKSGDHSIREDDLASSGKRRRKANKDNDSGDERGEKKKPKQRGVKVKREVEVHGNEEVKVAEGIGVAEEVEESRKVEEVVSRIPVLRNKSLRSTTGANPKSTKHLRGAGIEPRVTRSSKGENYTFCSLPLSISPQNNKKIRMSKLPLSIPKAEKRNFATPLNGETQKGIGLHQSFKVHTKQQILGLAHSGDKGTSNSSSIKISSSKSKTASSLVTSKTNS